MADRRPTNVVGDAPASQDEFGSHGPIADAICELIETESGGRTIGLEGGWGSGKSTVAQLLADRMKGSESHVFLFDTWAHEGDPLRRSFLDELIGNLIGWSWVDKETWTNRREALAKRRRVVHTRPVANLDTGAIIAGIVAVIFAALIAIGATLINSGLAGSTTSIAEVTTGAVLSGVPIVLTLVAAALFKSSWGGANVNWPSLFSVHSVTESKSETIETPDPTSIEFESTFKDLMRCALGSGSAGRRLILVVDNLDRVDHTDARTIWATLQTFLHHSHEKQEPWLESLWVLLPYDPTGIRRLWDRRLPRDPGTSDSETADAHEDQANGSVAESFIEKSIQVRFEVPLPLMSNWRSYLESNLQLALPGHVVADFYGPYRLYARKVTDDGRAPTPRELKQYVNRIGALHRQWQDTLPLSSLAYYAVLQIERTDVPKGLREGTLPSAALSGLLGEGVEGHLAALAFNTEPENAQQLLLGPLVERALTGPRRPPDEMNALIERPGFWEVLVQIPFSDWHSEVRSLLTAAKRLQLIPEERRPAAEWTEIRAALAEVGRSAVGWPVLDINFAGELDNLLKIVDSDSATHITSRATQADVEEGRSADWAEGTHKLLAQNERLSIRASGSAQAIYGVLSRFGSFQDAGQFAARLQVAPAEREELDRVIVDGVTAAPAAARRALEVLMVVDADTSLTSFVSAAAEKLRAPRTGAYEAPDADESHEVLRIIRLAGQDSSDVLTDLVREGAALHYASRASHEKKNGALGDWLYEEFREYPAGTHQDALQFPESSVGAEMVARLLDDREHQAVAPLAEVIRSRHAFDLIASIAADAQDHVLPAALIAELWESDELAGNITGERLLTLWPHISRAGAFRGQDAAGFVGLVGRRAELVTELTSTEFTTERMGIYASLIEAHPDHDEAGRLVEWVVDSLRALSRAQWSSAIGSSDDWVHLLIAIPKVNSQAHIGGRFAQGLVDFLDRVADGAEVSESIARNWDGVVLPSLAPAILGTYEEGVVAAAVRVSGNLPEDFFELTGRTLSAPAIFSRREVLNRLLPDLVESQNDAGLSWIAKMLGDAGARKSVPANGFDALIEAVAVAVKGTADVGDELRQIARLLDIPVESEADQQEETGATE